MPGDAAGIAKPVVFGRGYSRVNRGLALVQRRCLAGQDGFLRTCREGGLELLFEKVAADKSSDGGESRRGCTPTNKACGVSEPGSHISSGQCYFFNA